MLYSRQQRHWGPDRVPSGYFFIFQVTMAGRQSILVISGKAVELCELPSERRIILLGELRATTMLAAAQPPSPNDKLSAIGIAVAAQNVGHTATPREVSMFQ